MWNTLPNLTGSCAHGAKPIGGFGQVTPAITITYQSADLGRNLGQNTITNDYHRTGGRDIIDCYNGLGTVIDCG